MSSPSLGLPGSKKFRHAILKNLLLGLRKSGAASRAMSFHERRSAIRHAADAALATARGAAPHWSRTLAAELSQSQGRRPARDAHLRRPAKSAPSSSSDECKMACKRTTIPRRRLRARPKKSRASAKAAVVLARVMVRKRATALREIVPGGRGMRDECTLLGETLDYAVSLKSLAEVMQLLVRTLQPHKNPMMEQQ